MDLALISAIIIAVGILMYTFLDGFDLGVGILFPFAPDDRSRSLMMNSVAPVWDGNETWLILGGGGLLVFFPLVYSIVLPAFYIPVMAMLFALIFRGVAFEFRHSARTSKYLWDRSFFWGSFVAAFMQGILIGALISGVKVVDGKFAGGLFDWFSPFTVLTGLGVVFAYALSGACWTIWKTEGDTQSWARNMAVISAGGMLIVMAAVSVITPLIRPEISDRWFNGLNSLFLFPIPMLALVAGALLFYAILSRKEVMPLLLTYVLFVTGYLGIAISLWPHIVPPSVTIWDAIAPDSSVIFALIGVGLVLPMVLGYTVYAYTVFKGKVSEDEGYGTEH